MRARGIYRLHSSYGEKANRIWGLLDCSEKPFTPFQIGAQLRMAPEAVRSVLVFLAVEGLAERAGNGAWRNLPGVIAEDDE